MYSEGSYRKRNTIRGLLAEFRAFHHLMTPYKTGSSAFGIKNSEFASTGRDHIARRKSRKKFALEKRRLTEATIRRKYLVWISREY
jgi:hypothetical protein